MRNFIFVLAAVAVNAGFASQVPNPLLTLDQASGLVPPPLTFSSNCRVYGDRVQFTIRKAQQPPKSTVKAVRYTKEVPNRNQLVRLLAEAKRGQVVKQTAPTDGNSYHYQGIETVGAGAPKPFQLKQYYSGFYAENASPAAKKLVRLLDVNCK